MKGGHQTNNITLTVILTIAGIVFVFLAIIGKLILPKIGFGPEAVYYANYLVWFEVGRVNYLRQIGLDYATLEREGVGFMIVEATCRYHAPAHFDEVLSIRTWAEKVKNSSFALAYEVVNRATEQLLATGQTVQVFIGKEGKATRIPARLRTMLLEVGQ